MIFYKRYCKIRLTKYKLEKILITYLDCFFREDDICFAKARNIKEVK